MRTIRLIVEYDGTHFSGWQVQPGSKKTVQGCLQEAVHAITGERLRVRGASRTDAGVHARGQVAAFDTAKDDVPLIGFERGLTTHVPRAIVIRSAGEAEPGWNPRRTCRGKRYRYTYWVDTQPSAIERNVSWFVRGTLDLDAMKRGAEHLIGTHDFESFRSTSCVAKHAVRRIYEVKLWRGEYQRVHLEVVGNAFAKNMVRIIAGNLMEIGQGRRHPDDIPKILAARDRKQAGVTAPAQGLCLEEVVYDDRLPPRPEDDQDLEEG